MRPLVAHCHLGLGKLCRRSGDGVKGREHLTTAIAMYREMALRFWLEKAEAELRELGSCAAGSAGASAVRDRRSHAPGARARGSRERRAKTRCAKGVGVNVAY
jgi:hypothetical protein